jgi:hypothetical protein
MKIYLTYSAKDSVLAQRLTARLKRGGLQVWNTEEIAPGDNWAKKIGRALDHSEFMLILLTPKATESDRLRQDIEFALGSKKYEGRIFSVFFGPTMEAGKDMPWILLKQPFIQVDSTKDFDKVVRGIRELELHPVAG